MNKLYHTNKFLSKEVVSYQQSGFSGSLRKKKETNSILVFLSLSNNSTPELIKEELQMSKKLFKKAIGGLYKDEIIEIKQDGICLRKK